MPEKEIEYKKQHKNYKKKWEFPDDFPNEEVINAYWKPNVNESKEKFSWGKPNLNVI